jgi:hypothetical protein
VNGVLYIDRASEVWKPTEPPPEDEQQERVETAAVSQAEK